VQMSGDEDAMCSMWCGLVETTRSHIEAPSWSSSTAPSHRIETQKLLCDVETLSMQPRRARTSTRRCRTSSTVKCGSDCEDVEARGISVKGPTDHEGQDLGSATVRGSTPTQGRPWTPAWRWRSHHGVERADLEEFQTAEGCVETAPRWQHRPSQARSSAGDAPE